MTDDSFRRRNGKRALLDDIEPTSAREPVSDAEFIERCRGLANEFGLFVAGDGTFLRADPFGDSGVLRDGRSEVSGRTDRLSANIEDGDGCDECSSTISSTATSMFSSEHALSCSLHPHNITPRPDESLR